MNNALNNCSSGWCSFFSYILGLIQVKLYPLQNKTKNSTVMLKKRNVYFFVFHIHYIYAPNIFLIHANPLSLIFVLKCEHEFLFSLQHKRSFVNDLFPLLIFFAIYFLCHCGIGTEQQKMWLSTDFVVIRCCKLSVHVTHICMKQREKNKILNGHTWSGYRNFFVSLAKILSSNSKKHGNSL